jgi:hypothetical protein
MLLFLIKAFASQFVYCRKKLELDSQKINVNGGAMAFGHPLGATGTFLWIIEVKMNSTLISGDSYSNHLSILQKHY